MKSKRCVYFGGSFDPPHIGHLEMLVALAEDPWCDKIFVVPTSINPLKEQDKSLPIWSIAKNRLQWTQALMKEAARIATPPTFAKVQLVDREIRHPERKAYTVETLQELQEENPDYKLWTLAIGSDLIDSLHHWKDIETLLTKLDSVWVFPRNHAPNPLKDLNEKLKPLCEFRIMAKRVRTVSSSELRDLLIKDSSGASCQDLIPGQVLESIQNMLS